MHRVRTSTDVHSTTVRRPVGARPGTATAPPGPDRRRPRATGPLAGLVGLVVLTLAGCASSGSTSADAPGESGLHGGEASLALPDLGQVTVMGGVSGRALLGVGLLVCVLGLAFGAGTYMQLRRLPVHTAMREISELIYSTCRTYLVQQGRFLMLLWVFIAAVIVVYYRVLVGFGWGRVATIIGFSLLGMAGSYAVAWFGIRVNTFANSRTAFASLEGKPLPVHRIPMKSGMSIGMVLISLELLMMLVILCSCPPSRWARRRCGSRAASSPRSRTSAQT
jgi:K(+)-stimulated pyrophosphate-energized sodium pump